MRKINQHQTPTKTITHISNVQLFSEAVALEIANCETEIAETKAKNHTLRKNISRWEAKKNNRFFKNFQRKQIFGNYNRNEALEQKINNSIQTLQIGQQSLLRLELKYDELTNALNVIMPEITKAVNNNSNQTELSLAAVSATKEKHIVQTTHDSDNNSVQLVESTPAGIVIFEQL